MTRIAVLARLPKYGRRVGPVVLLGDAVVPEVRQRGNEVVPEGIVLALLEANDVRVRVREDLDDALVSLGPRMGMGVRRRRR